MSKGLKTCPADCVHAPKAKLCQCDNWSGGEESPSPLFAFDQSICWHDGNDSDDTSWHSIMCKDPVANVMCVITDYTVTEGGDSTAGRCYDLSSDSQCQFPGTWNVVVGGDKTKNSMDVHFQLNRPVPPDFKPDPLQPKLPTCRNEYGPGR